MLSASLIKIKLFTLLSMVCMGLFSRIVLGLPLILPSSTPLFSSGSHGTDFPTSGARTSLRFLPAPRFGQKRRRTLKDGKTKDEEITVFEANSTDTNYGFIGEVVDYPDQYNTFFSKRT